VQLHLTQLLHANVNSYKLFTSTPTNLTQLLHIYFNSRKLFSSAPTNSHNFNSHKLFTHKSH